MSGMLVAASSASFLPNIDNEASEPDERLSLATFSPLRLFNVYAIGAASPPRGPDRVVRCP